MEVLRTSLDSKINDFLVIDNLLYQASNNSASDTIQSRWETRL